MDALYRRSALAAVVVLCLLNAPLVMAQSLDSGEALNASLADHTWTHRVVIVAAPDGGAEGLREQLRALAGTDDAFRDRDMRLYTLLGEGASRLRTVPSDTGQVLTAASAQRMREQLDLRDGDTVTLLIGKDGTVKRRDAPPVQARTLFDQIDAMPMRQREMRRDDDGGR